MQASTGSVLMMISTLVGVIALLQVPLSAQKENTDTIAYVHTPDDNPVEPSDIYSVQADGTNLKALTKDGRSRSPSWSPDGKRILFVYETGKLYQMDRDGRNPQLLRDFYPYYFPLGVPVKQRGIVSAAWSPDGKSLAITASSDFDRREVDLFLLPADAQGELRLLVRNAWGAMWSPDGKKIAFSANPAPSRWEVHVVNADGSNEVKLTNYSVGGFAWSPDGKQIASTAALEVSLINVDDPGVRRLTIDPNWGCRDVTWSPDGKLIVVSCTPKGDCFGGGSFAVLPSKLECRHRLFAISPLDPQPKLIQITDDNAQSPAFAPVR